MKKQICESEWAWFGQCDNADMRKRSGVGVGRATRKIHIVKPNGYEDNIKVCESCYRCYEVDHEMGECTISPA